MYLSYSSSPFVKMRYHGWLSLGISFLDGDDGMVTVDDFDFVVVDGSFMGFFFCWFFVLAATTGTFLFVLLPSLFLGLEGFEEEEDARRILRRLVPAVMMEEEWWKLYATKGDGTKSSAASFPLPTKTVWVRCCSRRRSRWWSDDDDETHATCRCWEEDEEWNNRKEEDDDTRDSSININKRIVLVTVNKRNGILIACHGFVERPSRVEAHVIEGVLWSKESKLVRISIPINQIYFTYHSSNFCYLCCCMGTILYYPHENHPIYNATVYIRGLDNVERLKFRITGGYISKSEKKACNKHIM